MLQECLISDCKRKFSMENFKKESAIKVAKRNATKTPLKPRLRISIFQLNPVLNPGSRSPRIEQNGVASLTKEQNNLKQSESMKLKESAKNAKESQEIINRLVQYEFNCSVCNRQFKAKLGLNSNQRTLNYTWIL